ncbi:Dihydrofolate reductase [Cyberlindnera fabianii]|uniref:Dihydrofolate reductase n=1 Tax=Cyberlindnera fabianii TaxID=36022 RepID=A0A1V2L535_CYBFA|nr:Dihydrofolate reductase [Cyberlindnera fabianii]
MDSYHYESTTVKKPIAIVVAALLPSFGIGHKNALPWRLRQEMKYFKQLTTQSTLEEGQLNAVVMGRKTWESIPIKFRPLPGRINAVVTRSLGDSPTEEERGGATFYGSVESALRALSQRQEVARIFNNSVVQRFIVIGSLMDSRSSFHNRN